MGDWSKRQTILTVLGTLATIFAVMTIWAYGSGTQVAEATISEHVFEKEGFSEPHLTFKLERTTPIQLNVEGTTLDDSWLWTKVVIADNDNRAVGDYTFNLSYYSGHDWSEGDPADSQVMVLPAGTYKVIAYGEDPIRSRGWTHESRERLRISVDKNVVLARYPLAGLIIFGLAFAGYAYTGRESGGSHSFDGV